jgi:hypothetical protein
VTTASAVPLVIDALLTVARDLFEVNPSTYFEENPVDVYDGFGVGNDSDDYLMIGVDDPDVAIAQQSASAQQDWPHSGVQSRDETGEITCAAYSANGGSKEVDVKAARDGAYAIANALSQAVRENPTLGVSSLFYASYGTTSALTQGQGKDGVEALLIFKIAFHARLNQ